ncbi:MAG: slipin family protein, partial [Actinomycetota bacterium]
ADVMLEHPLALQLRNLQTLVEISVDQNSTIIFPSPLMSTIQELGAFLKREGEAESDLTAALAKLPAALRPAPGPDDA